MYILFCTYGIYLLCLTCFFHPCGKVLDFCCRIIKRMTVQWQFRVITCCKCVSVRTCCRTCHTMQVVSLEPEIRWMPQWSVDKQVTMSEGEMKKKAQVRKKKKKNITYSNTPDQWLFLFGLIITFSGFLPSCYLEQLRSSQFKSYPITCLLLDLTNLT